MNIKVGFGPFFALFLVFLTLKLMGHIAWSWWWVTLPLWWAIWSSLRVCSYVWVSCTWIEVN